MNIHTAIPAVFAASLAFASIIASAAIDDTTAANLMKKGGCNTCHSVDHKVVGPSYYDVAQKRKSNFGALDSLVKKVREGGKGEYGAIPMPPNPPSKISDAELHDLVEWILMK